MNARVLSKKFLNVVHTGHKKLDEMYVVANWSYRAESVVMVDIRLFEEDCLTEAACVSKMYCGDVVQVCF